MKPPLSTDAAAAPGPGGKTAVGWRFMLAHPAHTVALGFGSGLSPVAPGTMGTLWAWAAFLLLYHFLPTPVLVAVVALAFPLGWLVCAITARHMHTPDPGAIVWDEVAAFWLILLLVMPAGFFTQLAAFALFRLLDAAKPGPIRWADRRFHGVGARGGLGIMLDDLVAAFCCLLLMALWTFWRT